MKVNLEEYSEKALLHLLANDLLKRDKVVRHDLIIDQIDTKIRIEWLDFAHRNRAFQKPMKCTVRFTESGAEPFAITATLDPDFVKDIDEFNERVKNTLFLMNDELRRKHDLDKVEIESINVFEYHDIAKGF